MTNESKKDLYRIIYTAENEWALQSLVTSIDGEDLIYVDCYPDMRFASREDAEKFICESDISFSKGGKQMERGKAGSGNKWKPTRTHELRIAVRVLLDRISEVWHRVFDPPHPDRVELTEHEIGIIILGMSDALATYHKALSNQDTVSVPWEIVEAFLDLTDWSCYYCRHQDCIANNEENCCIANEARIRIMRALLGEGEVHQVK